MHVIALFMVSAIIWGTIAKLRNKTTGFVVGLGILGGILAVILGFCLYSWIPADFARNMLHKMEDGEYIIMYEVLPALIGSILVGVLLIPMSNGKTRQSTEGKSSFDAPANNANHATTRQPNPQVPLRIDSGAAKNEANWLEEEVRSASFRRTTASGLASDCGTPENVCCKPIEISVGRTTQCRACGKPLAADAAPFGSNDDDPICLECRHHEHECRLADHHSCTQHDIPIDPICSQGSRQVKAVPNSFGASVGARLMCVIGIGIMVSCLPGMMDFTGYGYANFFPVWSRALFAGLLLGGGTLLASGKEIGRHMLITCFPFMMVALYAAYSQLISKFEAQYTIVSILLYSILVYSVSRTTTTLVFRSRPCTWIGRGGLAISIMFLITLVMNFLPLENLSPLLRQDPHVHALFSIALLILLVYYSVGLIAVAIPTRLNIEGRSSVSSSDRRAAIITAVLFGFLFVLRVARPDLSSAAALARLSGVEKLGHYRVLNQKTEGVFEQDAFWLLEHPSIDIVSELKRMGYETADPFIFNHAYILFDEIGRYPFLFGGTTHYYPSSWDLRAEAAKKANLIVLEGGRPPPSYTGEGWYHRYHIIVASADGHHSMHLIRLWDMP